MIAHRTDCLSIRPSSDMIRLEIRWTYLDEIWYVHYAIGICCNTTLSKFPTVGSTNMAVERNNLN